MTKKSSGVKIAEGLGVAALAAGVAAVAAGYYFSGKEGKKHRKQVSAWSKQAKMEMVKRLKEMRTVSKQAYNKAAGEVLAKYKQAKNVDPEELMAFGQEIKGHWDKISKEVKKLGAKKAPAKKAKSS
jgi:hypothetical protein